MSLTKTFSYGKQSIDEGDINAVTEILRSEWLTQGPQISKFEHLLCKKFGSKYAKVVGSGTAALHLAGLALGWKANDIVLTTPITFLATANCILYCGATPDFVDIDPITYNIDIQKLESKIKIYQASGKKIKAVIAVDYAGVPCDWMSLRSLADQYEFQLVDDACHAIGAEYQGEPIGSSVYADVTVFSFHPVKTITSGEGGALMTNNGRIHQAVEILLNHGMTKDEQILEKNDGPWYYEMHLLGFNYRITDVQCALGMSQLEKLEQFVQKRQEIARVYDEFFNQYERFIVPEIPLNCSPAYHLYPLQIRFDEYSFSKKEWFFLLRNKNLFLQVHYIPIHLQPYYRNKFGLRKGDFPFAEKFYQQEVSIPIYPDLVEEDLDYIVNTISKELH